MKPFYTFIIILLTSLFTFAQADIKSEKSEPVNVPFFTESPVIDGKIDDKIWGQAAVLKDFIQTSPGNNIKPSKPTEVLIGYDEKHLYIAFKCWDDRDKIRATVAKRDAVTGEDNVRIWLDTFDDQRRAYIFAFNPLGIQQDGIYTENEGNDFSVDIVMESKGVIEDWGWTVEVKIPFKSLRYKAGKGRSWGFNAARNIDRFNDEFDEWMPQDRNIAGRLIQHGKITGLNNIKTERTLEIIPSITLSQTGNRVEGNRFVNKPVDADVGVNIKYTITSNITLDVAINPDFAKIEADAPVVTANQRFPIFFSEKRPFFLEGTDIFNSPLRVFNSRTIFDPDLAVKLTGKVGKNTFGFLGSIDNKRAINAKSQAAVLRIKRDFGKENNIGFFGTTNHFPERHNSLAGFDGRLKLSDKTTFNFQAVGTTTRGFFYNPNIDQREYRTGNGFAYSWRYNYSTDTRGFSFSGNGRTKDYRADLGFTRRVNTNSLTATHRISTKSKPNNSLIRFSLINIVNTRFDWQGRSQGGTFDNILEFNLQGNTFASIQTGFGYERLFEEEFGAKRNQFQNGAFFGEAERSTYNGYFGGFANKRFSKKLFANGYFFYNFNQFDFDFGAGPKFPRVSPAFLNDSDAPLDPGTGNGLSYGARIEYKPFDALSILFDYDRSRLVRNDTGLTSFDTNIFTSRTEYLFSRFIFARSRWDYETLGGAINGQLLFGWTPNPGTAFYIGYNDALRYKGFNNFTGQFTPGFERDSRTFFIRASYLFRKSF